MHATRIKLIALTGGIGSGKSTALRMFEARGAKTLDLDRVVHDLLERPEVSREVAACLGIENLAPGFEGRQQIADLVFADQEKLFDLEEILYPLVRREIERWRDRLGGGGASQLVAGPSVNAGESAAGTAGTTTRSTDACILAIVEAPMVFEAGMEDMFDSIVLVTAPEEIRSDRHARIVGRADFLRRSRRQMPEEEKQKRSDFIFFNTGSPDELDEFVKDTVAALEAKRC